MPLSLRRAAFWGSLAIVALVCAEITARIDDWIRLDIAFARTPDNNHDLKYQDWFGIRGRSNGRYRGWKLNNFGFRGPDIARLPAAGCTRLMVLGASETFGLYETSGGEYPKQLGDSLRSHGCYEVVNAAIAGAGLMAITRLWENYGATFHPAAVLIYPSPFFYVRDNPPVWPPIPGKPEQPNDLPFRPRLEEEFRNVWQTPAVLQRYRLRRWMAETSAGKSADWYFVDPPQDRLDLFMRDLDSLVKSVRATGARPVLMTHAMRPTIPPKPIDEFVLLDWRSEAPRTTDNALLGSERQAGERMRQYAEKNAVCLVDIDHAFSGHTEYFADFAHYNDSGSSAVAGFIARRLVSADSGARAGNPADQACAGIAKP
jgi:hypothetical protein